MKKLVAITCVSCAILAGCGGSPDAVSSGGGPIVALDPAKIASCWTSAGLQGDIYKFLTPAELGGLSKVGDASKDQVTAFKQCAAT
ncbi:MAG: 50S ribosomal protein L20 [Aliishimia sp.]